MTDNEEKEETADGGIREECGCVFYATASMYTAYYDVADCLIHQ